jgi:rhodanese-related sulfurtransferase
LDIRPAARYEKTSMGAVLRSLIGQMAAMVLVGGGLGLAVNVARPDGLPLRASPTLTTKYEGGGGACTVDRDTTRLSRVTVQEARLLHGQPGVTFVDARSDEIFRRGHIRGALLLPYEQAAQSIGKSTLPVPRDDRLIVYCDSADCQLSELLAQLLSRIGCERVRVLEGGYPAWVAAGLPTE